MFEGHYVPVPAVVVLLAVSSLGDIVENQYSFQIVGEQSQSIVIVLQCILNG